MSWIHLPTSARLRFIVFELEWNTQFHEEEHSSEWSVHTFSKRLWTESPMLSDILCSTKHKVILSVISSTNLRNKRNWKSMESCDKQMYPLRVHNKTGKEMLVLRKFQLLFFVPFILLEFLVYFFAAPFLYATNLTHRNVGFHIVQGKSNIWCNYRVTIRKHLCGHDRLFVLKIAVRTHFRNCLICPHFSYSGLSTFWH